MELLLGLAFARFYKRGEVEDGSILKEAWDKLEAGIALYTSAAETCRTFCLFTASPITRFER
jgi:hypothetical protein